MHYNEFIHAAKEKLNVDTEEEILHISRAFLHTLTAHMAGNAADNLGAQLPAPLLNIIRELSPEERDQGERFKLEEFYQRVAHKAGTDDATAKRYTHAFMDLLRQMVSEGEMNKLRKILSADYAPLFESVTGVQNTPQN